MMIFGKDKKQEKKEMTLPPVNPAMRKSGPLDMPPPPQNFNINIGNAPVNFPPPRMNDMQANKINLPPLPDDLRDPFFEDKEAPPIMPPPEMQRMERQFTPGTDITSASARRNPVPEPAQKEVLSLRKLSQVKGPVFISLDRYKEVKSILNSMKDNSRELRELTESFKDNKKEGADLLTKSVEKLENIEEDIENVNATLRV